MRVEDLAEPAAWGGIGGILTFLINFLWKRRVYRDEKAEARQIREDKLADHNSSLAIELLRITQGEAAGLRQQLNSLQDQLGEMPMLERRVAYFEEALLHIEHLLNAGETGNREAAEHNARMFMVRMVALRQIKGNEANAEQVARAATKRIEGEGE